MDGGVVRVASSDDDGNTDDSASQRGDDGGLLGAGATMRRWGAFARDFRGQRASAAGASSSGVDPRPESPWQPRVIRHLALARSRPPALDVDVDDSLAVQATAMPVPQPARLDLSRTASFNGSLLDHGTVAVQGHVARGGDAVRAGDGHGLGGGAPAGRAARSRLGAGDGGVSSPSERHSGAVARAVQHRSAMTLRRGDAHWTAARAEYQSSRLSAVLAAQQLADMLPLLPLHTVGHAGVGGSAGATGCSVCLEEYAAGDCVRTLPCLHMFHGGCVDPWLTAHASCPLCKTNPVDAIQRGDGWTGEPGAGSSGTAGAGSAAGSGTVGPCSL